MTSATTDTKAKATQDFQSVSLNRDQLRGELLGEAKMRSAIQVIKDVASWAWNGFELPDLGLDRAQIALKKVLGAENSPLSAFIDNSTKQVAALRASTGDLAEIKSALAGDLRVITNKAETLRDSYNSALEGLCATAQLPISPEEFKGLSKGEQAKFLKALDKEDIDVFFAKAKEVHAEVKELVTVQSRIYASAKQFVLAIEKLPEGGRSIALEKVKDGLQKLVGDVSADRISKVFSEAVKEAKQEVEVLKVKTGVEALTKKYDALVASLTPGTAVPDFTVQEETKQYNLGITPALAARLREFLKKGGLEQDISDLKAAAAATTTSPDDLTASYSRAQTKFDAAYKVLQAAAKQISSVSLTKEIVVDEWDDRTTTLRVNAFQKVAVHLFQSNKSAGKDDAIAKAKQSFEPLKTALVKHIAELLKIDGITAQELEASVKPLTASDGASLDLAKYAEAKVQAGIVDKGIAVDKVVEGVTKTCKEWAKTLHKSREELKKKKAAEAAGKSDPKKDEEFKF